jgi:hypothetical protein
VLDGGGVAGDGFEVGAGGLVGFGSALLPVAEGADGNLVASGEFLLGQAKGAAENFCSGGAGQPGHGGVGQGLCIGVGEGGGVGLGVGQCVEAGPVIGRSRHGSGVFRWVRRAWRR